MIAGIDLQENLTENYVRSDIEVPTVDTGKLLEAISELESQRGKIDQAISNLRALIQHQDGGSAHGYARSPITGVFVVRSRSPKQPRTDSHIAIAVNILRTAGRPMHVEEITERVSAMKNTHVTRASVEGALVRALIKNRFGITRPKPSTFGIETTQ